MDAQIAAIYSLEHCRPRKAPALASSASPAAAANKAAAWNAGRALTLEQAVEYALEIVK